MTEQRLPIVNSDDGAWGDLLNKYLTKEHYDTGVDNIANGGHKTITVQPGTTAAGTAPIKLTSGPLMSTAEVGAIEFNTDAYYGTITTGAVRKQFAFTTDVLSLDQTAPQATIGKFTFKSVEIDTPDAATKGLIVKGFAGQVADLQQWQGSDGTIYSYIGKTGNAYFPLLYCNTVQNSVSVENSRLDLSTTGTTIKRNIADTNSALIVNQVNTSSTGHILDFQFGGVNQSFISKDGIYYGMGLSNLNTSANANLSLSNNGIILSRNIADANPSLTINQTHASSTGAILSLQAEGVQKAFITKGGTLATPKIANLTTENNSAIFVNDNGLLISRNIADAGTCLTLNQINASSTGKIADFQFGGSTVASVRTSGSVYISGGYRGLGLYNSSNNSNSSITVPDTGAIISRDVADANTALIVNQVNASSTGKIADFQFGGISKFNVDKDGNLRVIGTAYAPSIYATGIYQTTGSDNAGIVLASTGTTIKRNIADANSALIVNQVNASSTGLIADFQFGGVSKATIGVDGSITSPFVNFATIASGTNGLGNSQNLNNAQINPKSTGTVISRNVADANTALIVNQVNASSTGWIAEFQFGGASKATIDKSGSLNLYGSSLTVGGASGDIKVGRILSGITSSGINLLVNDGAANYLSVGNIGGTSGTILSRNIADSVTAVTINQVNASSTGYIADFQFGGVSKAFITKDGNFSGNAFFVNSANNVATGNNAQLNLSANGSLITRNIADANSALIINQINASSTGKILDLQFGGASKAMFTKDGYLIIGGTTQRTILDVIAPPGADVPIFSTSYGNASGMMMYRANGTIAAPTTLLTDDIIGGLLARGYSGAAFTSVSNGGIYIKSGETWSGGTTGTYITLETTANTTNTRTEKMRILGSGYVGVNEIAPGAQLQVNASGAAVKGLIVKGYASQTANLFEVQNSSGASKVSVTAAGIVVVGSTALKDGGLYYASDTNAYFNPTTNGAIISRNIADANDALIVNQINTGSTGNIQQWQFGGVLKAQLSNAGAIRVLEMTHITTRNNGYIEMTATGVRINKNLNDANPSLVVNNYLGTGNLAEFKFNSVIKAKVDVDGVVRQQNAYAGIYVADGAVSQSIPTGTTYTKITAFTTDGLSNNCTADSANDKITITKTGRYRVSCNISFSDGSNITWRIAGFLGGVEQPQLHLHRKMGTGGDVGAASFSGFIDVTAVSTDLDLRARHDSGTSENLTVSYSNLNVEYIGE